MSVNKDQALDVAAYMSALDSVETVIEAREADGGWGDGLRATLPRSIEIHSDVNFEGIPPEVLGELVRDDLGWRFWPAKSGA